jgi:hypothetical protein
MGISVYWPAGSAPVAVRAQQSPRGDVSFTECFLFRFSVNPPWTSAARTSAALRTSATRPNFLYFGPLMEIKLRLDFRNF